MNRLPRRILRSGIRVAFAAALLLISCRAVFAGDEAKSPDKAAEEAQAAEMKKRELSERILKNAAGARDNLSGNDLGTSTQKLQQDVVADLDALIDLLKKSPPPSRSSSPNSDPSSDSQDQPQGASSDSESKSKKPKSQGTGTGGERDRPQDSEERNGESRDAKQRADRKQRLENDIWGHLPPALREQLLNTYGERMLPQYEEYVRKFYEALSEPTRSKKRPGR